MMSPTFGVGVMSTLSLNVIAMSWLGVSQLRSASAIEAALIVGFVGGGLYVIVTTTQSCLKVFAALVEFPVFGFAPSLSLIVMVDASDSPVIAVPVFVAHADVAVNACDAEKVPLIDVTAPSLNSAGPVVELAPVVYSLHFQSYSRLTAVIVPPAGTPRLSQFSVPLPHSQ